VEEPLKLRGLHTMKEALEVGSCPQSSHVFGASPQKLHDFALIHPVRDAYLHLNLPTARTAARWAQTDQLELALARLPEVDLPFAEGGVAAVAQGAAS